MLDLTNLIGFGGGGRSKVDLSYIASYTNFGPRTNVTVAGCNIGVASADRYVVVALIEYSQSTSGATTAMTIGGVAATKVAGNTAGGVNALFCSIWMALVPTGATADVVLTCATNINQTVFSIHTLKNLQNPAAYHTAINATSSGASISASINKAEQGAVIACWLGALNLGAVTWTGLSTETYDAMPYSNTPFSTAMEASLVNSDGANVTVTPASSGAQSLCIASWGNP